MTFRIAKKRICWRTFRKKQGVMIKNDMLEIILIEASYL